MKVICAKCELRTPQFGGKPSFPICICCGRAPSVAGALYDEICEWCERRCPKKERNGKVEVIDREDILIFEKEE